MTLDLLLLDNYARKRYGDPLHKFGVNLDADNSAKETVWDGGGNANANAIYDYSSVAETLYISSDDDTDTTVLENIGLDGDYRSLSHEQALNGQTKTEIGSGLTWLRYFRGRKKRREPNFAGTVYIYTNDTVVGGVPQTPANIRAVITADYQQTMMAVFTVPLGEVLVVPSLYASVTRLAVAAAAEMTWEERPEGGSFSVKEAWGIHTFGNPPDRELDVPRIISEKTDVELRCLATNNNSVIHAGFHSYLVAKKFI